MNNKLIQRVVFDRAGLWLALAAMLSVIAWRGWVVTQKPAHIQKIVEELASIGDFNFGLTPNHSNTYVVFSQQTVTGVAFFFCDTTGGGREKFLCEEPEKGYSWLPFGIKGWSPDDKLFAFCYPSDLAKYEDQIIIYDGSSGEVVTKLMGTAFMSDFTWLSPHSFAYSFWNGDTHDITVIEKKPDGDWVLAQTLKQIGNKEMTGMVATSPHSVAWRQGGDVWALDFNSPTPKKIWESTTNQLMEFTYSSETHEFLLNCSDGKERCLIRFRFNLRNKWTADAGSISNQMDSIHNVAWINNGVRYAYLSLEQGVSVFHIKTDVNTEPIDLPWRGCIENYVLNGDHLYIEGFRTNEAPGVWDYNIHSREPNLVVSVLEHPLRYASIVGADTLVFTNSNGKQKRCLLWPPSHIAVGKKYPLIIGQQPYAWWQACPQIAANGGCYFALVDRPSWFEDLENWEDEVMKVYGLMAKNPNVDTNQVFLYGMSAETSYVSNLLSEKPDLWRGAILFNPTGTPDPSAIRISSMLILDGTDDGDAIKRWTDYQNKAALEGITVKLAYVEGAQHVSHSTATEHQKSEEFARFLFGY
jgi:hypothetical protein